MPLISLRKVSRSFQTGDAEVGALREVTLDIHAGEFVAVMGPSGSGKTTLMNIIGCLDRTSSGDYYYQGRPTHKASSDERARLRREVFGFVFQSYNLLPRTSAKENVEIPAIYAGLRKRIRLARATELLSELGLSNRFDHHPTELSGGEQQRVAIARALMNGGEVVLADEPTGSLDSRSGKEIMEQLRALSARGRTVIVVTHDPGVARYAKRRIELLDGRVVGDERVPPKSRDPATTAETRWFGSGAPPQPPGARMLTPVLSLRESVRTAFRGLKGNKFRTALTLLGIVIGVLSVTAMLGVAEGMRRSILETFSALGGANLTVRSLPGQAEHGNPLTLEDAEAIRQQVPNLIYVAPKMTGGGRLTLGGEEEFAIYVATTASAMEESGQELAQGVLFTDRQNKDYEAVVVLGGMLAGRLFGENADPVGEYLIMQGAPYQVIGILRRGEGWRQNFGREARTAYVPLMTGAARLFNRDNLDEIEILVADRDQAKATEGAIHALLSQRHGAADFQSANQAEILEAQNTAANIMQFVFGAIGGISLIVAGIGVMNIMLAAVAERTREIGIRKAAGARQRDILLQFVAEAVVVCGLGGGVGLLLALLLGEAFNSLEMEVSAVWTAPILLVGFACATLTGLVFGYAPARRAARLDPVAALAAQ